MEIFFQMTAFIFGAIIGSFLNVCIVRLPLNQSVVVPCSHCMKCGKNLQWFDNIPILSWFILRGKCRYCKEPFSIRYAGVEVLTGLFFLLFYIYIGPFLLLIPYLFLISCLIIATFIDIEYRIIPDELSIIGIPFAFICCFLIPQFLSVKDISILMSGWTIGVYFIIAIFLLQFIEMIKTRKWIEKEEGALLLICLTGLFIQWAILFSPWRFSLQTEQLKAFCFSLQGVLIGGSSLYVMGLIGAVLISKRVVTMIDLKLLTQEPKMLFEELIKQGLLNKEGDIQKKFLHMASAKDLILSQRWQEIRKDIYDLMCVCQDSGVMGGGDIKLLALIGAFLGWPLVVVTFFVAPLFGSIAGIIEKIRTKSSAIAFGPYLVLGALTAIFWGERIIAWFFQQ